MYMVGHDMSSINVGTSRRCIDGSKIPPALRGAHLGGGLSTLGGAFHPFPPKHVSSCVNSPFVSPWRTAGSTNCQKREKLALASDCWRDNI